MDTEVPSPPESGHAFFDPNLLEKNIRVNTERKRLATTMYSVHYQLSKNALGEADDLCKTCEGGTEFNQLFIFLVVGNT